MTPYIGCLLSNTVLSFNLAIWTTACDSPFGESANGAQIGILITLQEPTAPMNKEAASAGIYDSPWGTSHARLQILMIEELLDGRRVGVPRSTDIRAATFKKAPRAKRANKDTGLFDPHRE